MGATRQGVGKVVRGVYFETTVLLPWEEGYYSAVALVAALEGEPVNGFFNEAERPRITYGRSGSRVSEAAAAYCVHSEGWYRSGDFVWRSLPKLMVTSAQGQGD